MTPWHQWLRQQGASFDGIAATDFGDPAWELHAARESAIVSELAPLAVLRVAGLDAEAFLQGQLTSDVEALAAGASQYSAWCSPKGRVLASFLLRRNDETSFELLLPAPMLEPIRKRLGMFVLRSKVRVEDGSAASVRIGIGGPEAPGAAQAFAGGLPALHGSLPIAGGIVFQLPGPRFVAMLDPEHAQAAWTSLGATARAAGFPCWRWLTLQAGVAVILPPTQDQFLPQTINWDALGGVSFRKGCYSGQEIVARTQHLGRLKERTLLAHADSAPIEPGTRLFSATFGDQPCGTIINAAPAPGGGSDVLAAAQLAAMGDLRIGSPGGPTLSRLPLPYDLPPVAPARERTA
jgi:tRNA-modifying protein YgfZ